MVRNENIRFLIKPEYFVAFAFTLLILPFKWVVAWIAACAFHEICHYTAIRLSGCKIFCIEIGAEGTVIDTEFHNNIQELICALSGPVGGFLLILMGKWFPRLAICGFFQSAYNLLPIYPLDGGRAVRCILQQLFPAPYNQMLEQLIEKAVLLFFLLVSLYGVICLKIGIMPLFLLIILILKNNQGKYACKESRFGVK